MMLLHRVEKKLKYYHNFKQLGGYLTPSEIHLLIKAGYQPTTTPPEKRTPNPKGQWFYFHGKKDFYYK